MKQVLCWTINNEKGSPIPCFVTGPLSPVNQGHDEEAKEVNTLDTLNTFDKNILVWNTSLGSGNMSWVWTSHVKLKRDLSNFNLPSACCRPHLFATSIACKKGFLDKNWQIQNWIFWNLGLSWRMQACLGGWKDINIIDRKLPLL